MASILIPLPARDFDPTEAAIPWLLLSEAGHAVSFATPDGGTSAADDMMLTGEGLDPWGFVPLLRKLPLFGRMLRAGKAARAAYAEMVQSASFNQPLSWGNLSASAFDGVLFPGGHRARGMRAYLESPELQRLAPAFATAGKPIGAICHGVLVLARSTDPATGRSLLFGKKTTALTWRLEGSAASLGRFIRFWDPHYYRTYSERPGEPAGYMSVQQEVTRALQYASDFKDVPPDDPLFRRKCSGLARDTEDDQSPSWVVRDGNYISARWPGDAYAFARGFIQLIEAAHNDQQAQAS
jgi:putative intracellular protease/amidase